MAQACFNNGVHLGIVHDAALADLAGLQFKLGLDQHQQLAFWRHQRYQRRQDQRQRDKGHVSGDQVELGRGVYTVQPGLAAVALGRRIGCGFRLGIDAKRPGVHFAAGLRSVRLHLGIIGVVAVVVVSNFAAAPHPAIGRLGLRVVHSGRYPVLGQHQLARFLQRFGGERTGVQALHAQHPGIDTQLGVQLGMAHVHTGDLGHAGLQQAVGETAGGLAHVQHIQVRHVQADMLQCSLQLEPAARNIARLGIVEQLQRRILGDIVFVLGHIAPFDAVKPAHPPGNEAHGLGAGCGHAAFY